MQRPRPSASTLAAVLSCSGKTLVAAALPRREWIEYDTRLPGYSVSHLLLAFEDGESLNLWSEQVNYGPEPWHEAFVLAAESREASSAPLDVCNAGAPQGFELAAPLQAVFAGQRLECIEMFVPASDIYPGNALDFILSDSVRVRVGEHVVELATEGADVPTSRLVLRSQAFPAFASKSTGRRELLSQQRVLLERPSTPRGDA